MLILCFYIEWWAQKHVMDMVWLGGLLTLILCLLLAGGSMTWFDYFEVISAGVVSGLLIRRLIRLL
jgi:hypothetical protein